MIKVLPSAVSHSAFRWDTAKGIHTLKEPALISVGIRHGENEKLLRLFFKKGYRTDGLSVPFLLRWFLPTWRNDDPLYNLAGACHDAGYMAKGWGVFSRSEMDDLFRGLLRESGENRLKGSGADWAVGLFAGSHWGDDALGCTGLVEMELREYGDV